MKMMNNPTVVNVIGAGLAGCECAWQLAKRNIQVNLYEAKPTTFTKAHKSKLFAELICSNSLKAKRTESAAGLLKAEMQLLDSLILQCAYENEVDAGGALAVDRDKFSYAVTQKILENPLINVINEEVCDINQKEITVIATGPLTLDKLSSSIKSLCGDGLYFFDAVAPIVTFDSIDKDKIFFASRYEGNDNAYINCPFNKEEYEHFYNELVNAQSVELKEVDKSCFRVYEGCMPIEVMAKRGIDTLRFGPLKPVGLINPKTMHRPWANVQLRKENNDSTLYNLVGFQTNLKFPEQKRVFSMIPGLENAEFVRYGVMHRNTFINSPKLLNKDLSLKTNPNIYFAGQISGVEGYMESAFSGLITGINIAMRLSGKQPFKLDNITMIGSLLSYITDPTVVNFQPMGANFGIIKALDEHIKDKKLRNSLLAKRSLDFLTDYKSDL
ncbi:MAG: methylenetetrahydrofolate--tRNA-(uracil(54)-C(5))-methyltransferase (FADH(2)-oxidizing) TrmFO [Clostridia bacterium]|nr:methylenetetrahydrofolate--tRNA-(uracil(54)-C(5))-methyltransferase (FADH(2)-oxidizing) TrmFO [Clostridia bacterium]